MTGRKNAHAAALGRLGGRVRSEAKRRAAKINAQKAGRKPKFDTGDRVIATDAAPASYRGARGTVIKRGARRAEYGVRFDSDDGLRYVMSWLLKPA